MIHRIATALLLTLGLWLITPAADARAADCRQQSPEIFVLTGEINRAMADCVAERFQPTTREVIVNSRGGSVEAALDIAERFEGKRLTLRVRRECNSSCANYFVPLAARLVIERGAVIGLHGSIDPMLIAGARERGETVAAVNASRTAQRQMAFARRNNIHPGWLLYRLAGATSTEGLDGAWGGQRAETRMFLVEERMARSCLPNVEIVPYQADLDATVLRPDRLERLHRRGIARSAGVVCNGMTWDDFPPPEAAS
jgi:hypothetical protein